MSDKKETKNKFVIYQRPNLPLIVFIVFYILGLVIKTAPTSYLIKSIEFGSIFTWAWMEIIDGENTYRKVLGIVVMIASISSVISFMQHIAK